MKRRAISPARFISVSWANGYAVGDTFKGGTVVTPSTRGNIYLSVNKSAGMLLIKNTILGAGKPREITSTANSSNYSFDYNLYYPLNNNVFFSNDALNNQSWTIYHSTNEPHSQNADPLFVDVLNANFRLGSTSPAIDSGADLGLFFDFAGSAVPQGGAPDMGAYEFASIREPSANPRNILRPTLPESQSCGSTKPYGIVDLFQIDRSGSKATLFFTPSAAATRKYNVIFGHKDGEEHFGGISIDSQNENQGVQSLTVDHLDPHASYSFKILPTNGCAVGDWSNWLGSKGSSSLKLQKFYRYTKKL